MKALVPLVAVLLASHVFAEAPVPAGLLPERSVPDAQVRSVPFRGLSSIASRGDRFTVVTTNVGVGPLHGVREVDTRGLEQGDATLLVGNCGEKAGVASDGERALVVWGCHGATTGWLSLPDGTSRSIVIHDPTRAARFPRDFSGIRDVAWDGTQFVVLSTLETPGTSASPGSIISRAIATRVASDGRILQNDIDLGGSGYAIAARAGVSVALLQGPEGVLIRPIRASGFAPAPRRLTFPYSPLTASPAIAGGANGFLVIWSDGFGVRARHLSADGMSDGNLLLLDLTPAQFVAVTAERDGYYVAWTSGQELRGTRIGPNGAAAFPRPLATTGSAPALASNGEVTMLVSDEPYGIRVRPVDGWGGFLHALHDPQFLESIALTGSVPDLAWKERSGFDGRITGSHLRSGKGHLVSEAGTYTHLRDLDRALFVLGWRPPFAIRFADEPEGFFQVPSRRLFWTGNGFLAVWSDPVSEPQPGTPGPLYVQRFGASGTALDATPRAVGFSFPLDASYSGPANVYSGVAVGVSNDEILLTWVDPAATLQGVIIRQDETIPVFGIATPQALANPVEVTSDGKDFLVTWISNADTIHAYVGSRRVLAGGAMPEEMRVQTAAGTAKERMATFWTGEHYLVVWSSAIDFGIERTISAIRIARDGTLMDYPERALGSIEGYWPQFAFRDGQLALAYVRDGRVWWRYAGTPRRRAAR